MNATLQGRRSSPALLIAEHSVLVAYILLLLLVGVAIALNPAFGSLGNLKAQLLIASFVGIIAIGQTFVILTGHIDLSVPWNLTFSAILAATCYANGYGIPAAFGLGIGFGALVGAFNAVGVAIFRVHSLVWTLATNALLQGLALLYINGQPPRSTIPPFWRDMVTGDVGGLPMAALLWLVLAVLTIVVLKRTSFGRKVYATGTNETAAFLSGIDTRLVYLTVFIISGASSAVAGLLLTGYASQTYLGMGNDYLLVPIAAVIIGGTSVLGGTGGYVGSIAGTLMVVVLQAVLSTAQIGQAGKNIIFGGIILLLVLLYGRAARVND
ncbi:monosaccharide ABC transporter membrane protein, CUT2 family [Arboricoccus pini]|uniref:Monosaccharide ABC transporter membrane protein, CUT2 family n=1 Tax=Arboricoccus pini TaxID=1963835 RepID=A0A212S0Z6_9PROT|nr:ABC transporter permease [Arboricoccus pini]SNB78641.1 monosaccharide ABC transporter membrane protein, CUT2 family [Arboricoccus pini]